MLANNIFFFIFKNLNKLQKAAKMASVEEKNGIFFYKQLLLQWESRTNYQFKFIEQTVLI